MAYLPFGNVLFEEHSSSFSSPYLFNGKELDRETGLSYFHARYYDNKYNIWLNVDKKAERFQNYGSYIYAFNNPVRFVDPDGNAPIDPPGTWGKIKAYADYQWNTKIPNDLKNIRNELDNGWRFEKGLKGGKAGGYDFRSSFRNTDDSRGKVQKRRGNNNTQVVDISGIDALSTFLSFSAGTKTISKSGKIVGVLTDYAKAVQATPNAWFISQNTGDAVNQEIIEITNKFYTDNVNHNSGEKKVVERVSVTKDTMINTKDKAKVILNQRRKNEARRQEEQRKLD
ncbi:RHS repeat-associated core domain-containing protein [Flavobacterium branchiarum]|uniref:RHS repeat-associated core domain-containing protein n=1 Tax=Flavobacterium branchiarum TaxID=1114870 RepID=A0ABV5FL66_9FLAO|nr:RHS repeat-associated core domain-containing protein [Flavobacterium branchiarum]MDN3672421.1 RHS repeat-associated core domain-containing protein [Flavobacterium branchiarum]